jgi:hypothetical protein
MIARTARFGVRTGGGPIGWARLRDKGPGATMRVGRPSARRLTVPDGELECAGGQLRRAQQRQPHRELGAIGELAIVARVVRLRGQRHRGGLVEAGVEPADPGLSPRADGAFDEVLLEEWQHQVQLAATLEDRLGDQDVGAAGQRAIGDGGLGLLETRPDPFGQPALRRLPRAKHVTGVGDHRGGADRGQQHAPLAGGQVGAGAQPV